MNIQKDDVDMLVLTAIMTKKLTRILFMIAVIIILNTWKHEHSEGEYLLNIVEHLKPVLI